MIDARLVLDTNIVSYLMKGGPLAEGSDCRGGDYRLF